MFRADWLIIRFASWRMPWSPRPTLPPDGRLNLLMATLNSVALSSRDVDCDGLTA